MYEQGGREKEGIQKGNYWPEEEELTWKMREREREREGEGEREGGQAFPFLVVKPTGRVSRN